ncbi:hypothetical protein [uncultured Vibrio sp.]|uniref:hypothetical protein n=1 Tax=uncultured Vibrio sp. TaxID=114054 RepID=UPI0009141387|nr:hypothetical protein [uncultured Vibrio sp.]OIQ25723.1 MAG: hypothetical protein BM561_04795 [Vibrio sp. MedPE-SWchi]
MNKCLLTALLFVPSSAFAIGVHISPEYKVGLLEGAGLQLGVTNVWGMDAVYGSYHEMSESNSVYEHTTTAYRVGAQKMFGQNSRFGFQAEIGYAEYEGQRDFWGQKERSKGGLSLGGAYVYQVNEMIGLRAGMDINLYGMGNTYFTLGAQPSFSFGANFHF